MARGAPGSGENPFDLWEQATRRILQSPATTRQREWRRGVEQALVALTGADRCVLHLAASTDPEPSEPRPDAIVRPGIPEDRVEFSRAAGLDPKSAVRTPISMIVHDAAGCHAWLTVFCTTEREGAYAERAHEIMESVLPAFRSAVRTRWRFELQRSSLGRTIDALDGPALLCNEDGRPLVANEKLMTFPTSRSGDARLRGSMEQVARQLARTRHRGEEVPDRMGRNVETERGPYRISGTVIEGTEVPGLTVAILVSARPAPEPPPEAIWEDRFELTPRQTEVARLLLSGQSNEAMATELGISRYTVEHHVRAVLTKLNVPSRAAVPARLREVAREARR